MIKIKRLIEDNTKDNLTQYIPIINNYLNKPLDKDAQSELWINTDRIKTSHLLRLLGYNAEYKKDSETNWTILTITKKEDN